MNPKAKMVLGGLLFALGIVFGIFRGFGYFGNPLAVDGGLLVIAALVGPGIYLVGTGIDDLRG